MEPVYIEMKNSYKRYQVGDTGDIANNDVNFELKRRVSHYFRLGGAGKSTVLNILEAWTQTTTAFVDGVDISRF